MTLYRVSKDSPIIAALIRAAEMGKDGIDPEGDYEVDEKQRSCILTDQGFAKCEEYLGVNDLYNPQDPWAHYITNALKAKELFIKDVNYILENNYIKLLENKEIDQNELQEYIKKYNNVVKEMKIKWVALKD